MHGGVVWVVCERAMVTRQAHGTARAAALPRRRRRRRRRQLGPSHTHSHAAAGAGPGARVAHNVAALLLVDQARGVSAKGLEGGHNVQGGALAAQLRVAGLDGACARGRVVWAGAGISEGIGARPVLECSGRGARAGGRAGGLHCAVCSPARPARAPSAAPGTPAAGCMRAGAPPPTPAARTAVDHEGGAVEAGHGDDGARHVLVAAGQADVGVVPLRAHHRLNRVWGAHEVGVGRFGRMWARVAWARCLAAAPRARPVSTLPPPPAWHCRPAMRCAALCPRAGPPPPCPLRSPAMISRDCRLKDMPSVPMEIPSDTPMVLNCRPTMPARRGQGGAGRQGGATCVSWRGQLPAAAMPAAAMPAAAAGEAWTGRREERSPASCTPALTSRARSFRCMLQGLPSHHTLLMPTCVRRGGGAGSCWHALRGWAGRPPSTLQRQRRCPASRERHSSGASVDAQRPAPSSGGAPAACPCPPG